MSKPTTTQPRFDKGKRMTTAKWQVRVKIYDLCRERNHVNGQVPLTVSDTIHSLYGPNGSVGKIITRVRPGKKVSQGSCFDRWKQSRILIAIEKQEDIPHEWLSDYMDEKTPDATGTAVEIKASQDVRTAVLGKQEVSWKDVWECREWLKKLFAKVHDDKRTSEFRESGVSSAFVEDATDLDEEDADAQDSSVVNAQGGGATGLDAFASAAPATPSGNRTQLATPGDPWSMVSDAQEQQRAVQEQQFKAQSRVVDLEEAYAGARGELADEKRKNAALEGEKSEMRSSVVNLEAELAALRRQQNGENAQ